jgi:predicted nucleotidyltransferase
MELDEGSRSAAVDFAGEMASFWDRRLGSRLLGFYLIGSLAHGGFSRRYSDIDMALLVDDGLGEAELAAVRERAIALSPELAEKSSLFWADRTFSVGRFPPLDRVDLVDNAVAVLERERIRPVRPNLTEVRAYLADLPFQAWADGARRFASSTTMEAKDRKPYLRTLLYPARFIFSWKTGRMGSNDEAVDFVLTNAPPGLELELVVEALKCRRAARDPDALFAARDLLHRQVGACRRVVKADSGQ